MVSCSSSSSRHAAVDARRQTVQASTALDVHFTLNPDRLAEVIARLVAEDVTSLPLLNEEVRRPLLDETARLSFRKARPVVGKRGRRVRQDFAYCTSFPAGGGLPGPR